LWESTERQRDDHGPTLERARPAVEATVAAGGAGGARAGDGGGMRSVHACVAKCGRACLARARARCLDRVSYLRRLK
jgi:hypothetical protein